MTNSRLNGSVTKGRAVPALLAALVAAAVLCALPAEADARKRMVVLEVDGPGGDRIAHQLRLLVERRHATVSASRFTSTARDIGAESLTDDQVARVARRLAVDGLVVGEVAERNGNYRLTVRLREGQSGSYVHTLAVRLESPELTRSAARQIWRMLMPAIEGLSPIGIVDIDGGEERSSRGSAGEPPSDLDVDTAEPSGEDDDQSSGAASPEQESDDSDAEDESEEPTEVASAGGAPGQRGRLDDENPLAGGGDDGGGDVAIGSGDSGGSREAPVIDITAGMSGSQRSFSFSHDPDIPDEPGRYRGQFAPGAYVDATVYPLAPSREDHLAGLGVTAMIDHVLLIESQFDGVALPTSQSRMGAGVAYRLPLGEPAEDSPVFEGSLRLSRHAFTVDRDPAPGDLDLPNVRYIYLDPGVALRVPAGSITLRGEARGVLALSTGEIQRIDQYGTASVFGGELDAGVGYTFADDFEARVGFRFTGISHSFSGDGALTDRGGDGDPDVSSARDLYTGGYLVIGYQY